MANNAVVIDTEIRIDQAKKEISNLESYIKNLEATKERMDRIFPHLKKLELLQVKMI